VGVVIWQFIKARITPEDWKRSVAYVILHAYFYQLVFWPLAFWASTIISTFTGILIPAPPIVPWEQLMAGTTTLAAIGGVETWREKNRLTQPPKSSGTVNDKPTKPRK
jgi:hypothetical protein